MSVKQLMKDSPLEIETALGWLGDEINEKVEEVATVLERLSFLERQNEHIIDSLSDNENPPQQPEFKEIGQELLSFLLMLESRLSMLLLLKVRGNQPKRVSDWCKAKHYDPNQYEDVTHHIINDLLNGFSFGGSADPIERHIACLINRIKIESH